MKGIVRSTVAPDWLLHHVAATYNIPSPQGCELLQSGSNDKYLIVTGDGQFLVRLYRAGWRPVSEIPYELDLLDHLAARGVRVPAPMPARDGSVLQFIRAPEGIRPLALCSYPQGRWFTWDTEEVSYLGGRTLANVHAATHDFSSRHARTALDTAVLIDRPLAALSTLLAHRPTDWTYISNLAGRLYEALAAPDGFDWGVCHGDLSHRDARLGEAGQMALLDFDCCGPGWRAYDLAAAEECWLYQNQGPLWASFLRGYTAVRDLNAADLAALPVFHMISRLRKLGTDAALASEWGAVYLCDENLDYYLGLFRQWESKCLAVTAVAGRDPRRHKQHGPVAASDQVDTAACSDGAHLPRPVITRSILSSDAVLAEVAGRYSIDGPVSCELLRRSSNDTYLLKTRRDRFIARVYGFRWRSRPEICYELELLVHLAANGVPVSAPVSDREGRLASPVPAPEGNRQMALFEYSEGRRLSWEDEHQAFLAGKLAACIHGGAANFTTRHSRPRWDLEYLLDLPLSLIRPFFNGRPEDWAYLEGLSVRLRRRFQDLLSAGLEQGICHGDFNAKNIHVAEGARLSIFDFDWCGSGWVAQDCVGACRIGLQKPRIWQSFLNGYREVGRLEPADIEAVRLLPGLKHIWMLGNSVRAVPAWGSFLVDGARMDQRLAGLRQWQAQQFSEAREAL